MIKRRGNLIGFINFLSGLSERSLSVFTHTILILILQGRIYTRCATHTFNKDVHCQDNVKSRDTKKRKQKVFVSCNFMEIVLLCYIRSYALLLFMLGKCSIILCSVFAHRGTRASDVIYLLEQDTANEEL